MKKYYTLIFLALCIIVAGCSSLPKELSQNNIKVDPSILEAKNNKVEATITATFPKDYLPPKGTVTVVPVLKYNNKESLGDAVTYQGSKVIGNDKSVGSTGGIYTQKVSFKYNDDMRKSKLYARVTAKSGKKEITFPDIWVADGIMATYTLASAEHTAMAIGQDKFQRIIEEQQEADIRFVIEQAKIRSSELNKEDIQTLIYSAIAAQKELNKDVKSLDISAYASPDGTYNFNEKLATKRGSNTKKELESILKKNQVEKASFSVDQTAEDWEGFRKLMEKSNIEDKDLILRVLSMYSDPEVREREIKSLSSAFQEVADQILPKLRRSKLSLTVETIGKSDTEIKELSVNNPSSLSVEELIYSANLTDNLKDKSRIYSLVESIYPNDWRGYNNLGVIKYKGGDFNGAKVEFESAKNLNSSIPEVNNNVAVLSLMDGDIDNAQILLGKAGAVQESSVNLALASLMKGDYAAAASQYGESPSNNSIVAHIMNKDYNNASKALDRQPNKDALSYYLAAIIGARTNNESDVKSNLAKAISMDPSFIELAKLDAEFYKYPNILN